MERFLKWSAPVLVCCAAALTAVTIKQEVAIPRSRSPQRVSDWRSYAERGQRLGPASAPVTVVVFSDYECPFSRRLAEDLRTIQSEMPSMVSVVYRHYPLKNHAQAVNAAAAVECAARQGRFRELHDLLTTSVWDNLGAPSWAAFASHVGIQDTLAFARCMASPGIAALIEADRIAGRKLGVPATPTMLVNDQKYVGMPGNLDKIVRVAAAKAARN